MLLWVLGVIMPPDDYYVHENMKKTTLFCNSDLASTTLMSVMYVGVI